MINREFCLRNFRLRYWWLHEVRSSNCGKITDSFFCLCLLMLFPCTWWLTIKDSLDKCDTSFGVIFQMGDNSVNLICLYKSLEMMMIKSHFTVNRLFVLDTCLCWNKWKITVDRFSCKWTEWFSKEYKTTCYVIVNWHIHIWNSRLLYQKCTPRKGLSFMCFHAMDYILLWNI